MSSGNISRSKLKSPATRPVRCKLEFHVQAMGASASARAVSVDGDVDQHTIQICEMDEHKGELARLMTEMDVWCANPAPAPDRPRTFITLVIDQQRRSICPVSVPSGQHHGAFRDSQSNKENANV